MSAWDDYQREEREEQAKVTGKLRCVIVGVEETEVYYRNKGGINSAKLENLV